MATFPGSKLEQRAERVSERERIRGALETYAREHHVSRHRDSRCLQIRDLWEEYDSVGRKPKARKAVHQEDLNGGG